MKKAYKKSPAAAGLLCRNRGQRLPRQSRSRRVNSWGSMQFRLESQRMMDTVKTVDRLADPSSTSRAYKAVLADKSLVTVAWSNCARLTNDTFKQEMRKPTLPWENQWKKSENVSFAAAGAKVVVTDSMGNATEYKAENGRVTIPLNGSPVFITGLK